jgi:hypothetical protein
MLVNVVKFPIDGGNNPVKLLEAQGILLASFEK